MELSTIYLLQGNRYFLFFLHKIIDQNCSKVYRSSSKSPIWFSNMLKNLFSSKKIAHKIYKEFPSSLKYNKFSISV